MDFLFLDYNLSIFFFYFVLNGESAFDLSMSRPCCRYFSCFFFSILFYFYKNSLPVFKISKYYFHSKSFFRVLVFLNLIFSLSPSGKDKLNSFYVTQHQNVSNRCTFLCTLYENLLQSSFSMVYTLWLACGAVRLVLHSCDNYGIILCLIKHSALDVINNYFF